MYEAYYARYTVNVSIKRILKFDFISSSGFAVSKKISGKFYIESKNTVYLAMLDLTKLYYI